MNILQRAGWLVGLQEEPNVETVDNRSSHAICAREAMHNPHVPIRATGGPWSLCCRYCGRDLQRPPLRLVQ